MEILRGLEDMNPDLSHIGTMEITRLAGECPPEAFEPVAGQVRRLIDLFLESPQARAARAVMKKYFSALEASARLLQASGEINSRAQLPENGAGSFSTSLVLYSTSGFTPLEKCLLLSRAEVPEELTNAADAVRRRLEVVETVFSLGFAALDRIDRGRFIEWAADYLEENQGALAPEVIRDLLVAMRRHRETTPQIIRWLFRWCADGALLEHWPLVTKYADRMLGTLALAAWGKDCPAPRNRNLAHLKLLAQNWHLEDEHILPWLANTLCTFGESIQRFMHLDEDGDRQWTTAVLQAELRTLASCYEPILIAADRLLNQPGGAAGLAMAFLGIVGSAKEEWEERIRISSEKVIRRAFMQDLKEGRTPVETIRRYTFGDMNAFTRLCNELDLVTQQFDSIAQREKVVARLAVFYAGYRREAMLGMEVARRYRRLAKILHEDFLGRFLEPEELDKVRKNDFLQELYTMAARIKRFLDHRRALQMSVEEMISSEIEFAAELRQRRLKIIRRIIKADRPDIPA